jgi:hypothetical protein
MNENDDMLREHVYQQEIVGILRARARGGMAWDEDLEFAADRIEGLERQRNGLQEVYERALLWKHRYQDALDRITKHPKCHRLIMQIACEALRGGVEREEG